MYSVSLLLFILSVQTDGIISDNSQCTYKFKQNSPEDKNNYNVAGHNSSYINYCTAEDVPNDISFGVRWDESGGGDLTDSLKVEFAPPKRECKYGVALLINPSVKDERECEEYKFEEAGDTKSQIHTIERNVCVFQNQFVRYNYNSTVSMYEDNIGLWFQYIFTGCYALRFHIGNQKYIIRDYKFLNTTYQRMEITEPQFACKYDVRSNFEKRREVTNFTLNTSLPADTGSSLQLALISPQNKDLKKGCIWQNESILYLWTVNLEVSTLRKTLTDRHCDIKLVQVNGKYMKTVRCHFQYQLETQTVNYCFVYHISDDRCYKNTTWKPQYANNAVPCMWAKHCVKTSENSLHIENTNAIKSDKLPSTSSYLMLPIIAIVLIISAAIGILCFWHYLRIRKEEVALYVNPQHDDSDCLKSTDLGIIDNASEKGIGHDNPSCDDIVLLYTNSSTSFMTLMKDFRETLAKMCACSVHDWHDGAVWNEVAKVGAVSWFTELLNNGCRVVWIDTPATRSAVISNSRNNESSLYKLSKYYEIHDFRDMAFRVVLEVAKNKMNDVARQYRRHFVVKFEGLESTANVNDPFLDLSPHARYCMPQHLMQLCSDLSVEKSEISKYKMKVEEDLYRIFVYQLYKSQTQQRLKFMKMESTI